MCVREWTDRYVRERESARERERERESENERERVGSSKPRNGQF